MNQFMVSKTRIAPTPSGFLHLGNIFSFSLTAGLANELGASILLRIDDLDTTRVRTAYLEDIFETLHFMGIPWDEGPLNTADFNENWTQLKRLSVYEENLKIIEESDLVFACNCSRKVLNETNTFIYPGTCIKKNLPLDAPGVCWRWKHKLSEEIKMNDLATGGTLHMRPELQHHFVVRKRDGMPSYQLASVLDDSLFNVNMIVRGSDLYESTLIQLQIAQKLQLKTFDKTVFFHHPLISDENGHKLSKSTGSTSISYLRKEGLKSETIFELISAELHLKTKVKSWHDLYQQWKKENSPLFFPNNSKKSN